VVWRNHTKRSAYICVHLRFLSVLPRERFCGRGFFWQRLCGFRIRLFRGYSPQKKAEGFFFFLRAGARLRKGIIKRGEARTKKRRSMLKRVAKKIPRGSRKRIVGREAARSSRFCYCKLDRLYFSPRAPALPPDKATDPGRYRISLVMLIAQKCYLLLSPMLYFHFCATIKSVIFLLP